MRILHVCHQYRPAIGGAERYITQLSEEMAARGHQVDVFTSRSDDYMTWRNQLPKRETIRGVQVHRFSSLRRRRYTWVALDFGISGYARTKRTFYEPFVLFGNGPISPSLALALLRNINEYDIVHIASLHYAHAWTAFTAAKLRKVPVAITPMIHIGQPETYDMRYMRRVVHDSDIAFALTEAERKMLQDEHMSRRAVVAGSGLHLEQFPPLSAVASRAHFNIAEDAFVVLFLGRKTGYKGLNACIEAVKSLRDTYPNAVLLAVGPETEYSRELWSQVKGRDGLVVRGTVSETDRLAALAASDVLTLPSSGESFGIVYLEAWAYGKPVIGGNIAATASLIDDGINGYVVDPHDVATLAQRLSMLASTPALASRLGANGRRKLESRYSWTRICDIVEGAYIRALRRGAKADGAITCA
jgi:glycosyltransferase involved in cell wall biosynthesis